MRRALSRLIVFSLLAASGSAFAAGNDSPVIVEQLPNPNDYTLFANAGWDGNWYVGYDTCWIKRLPPVPAGSYSRAYIGVKLGRAKAGSTGARPWEKEAIPGDIYAAISSTTAWTAGQEVRVAAAADIPLDGDPENAIEDVGESQWFWAPIPISDVSLTRENNIAVWSPTPAFVSVSSSPILAAGWGGKEVNSWIVRGLHGAPPRKPVNPNPGISYFQPGIALKLIPSSTPPHPLSLRIIQWIPGTPDHLKPVLSADVSGDAIEKVWVEAASARDKKWRAVSRPLWKVPYTFSLDPTRLPSGAVKLRVAATNIWEDQAASAPIDAVVSSPAPKH